MRVKAFACTLALSVMAVSPSLADIVEIGPSKDNSMFFEDGNLSNGAGQYLFAGKTAFGAPRRALLEFDIAGAVPLDSTIDDVTLTLHMSKTIVGPKECSLHRVAEEWGEAGSDAPGEEGTGTQAEEGDATWTNTFWPETSWGDPGGVFSPVASATQSVAGTGFYSWNAPELTHDAQGFSGLVGENHGWILICDESEEPTAKRFDSREHPDESRRPVLTIEFSPPPDVPALSGTSLAALTLVLMTLGALAVKRSRATPTR